MIKSHGGCWPDAITIGPFGHVWARADSGWCMFAAKIVSNDVGQDLHPTCCTDSKNSAKIAGAWFLQVSRHISIWKQTTQLLLRDIQLLQQGHDPGSRIPRCTGILEPTIMSHDTSLHLRFRNREDVRNLPGPAFKRMRSGCKAIPLPLYPSSSTLSVSPGNHLVVQCQSDGA